MLLSQVIYNQLNIEARMLPLCYAVLLVRASKLVNHPFISPCRPLTLIKMKPACQNILAWTESKPGSAFDANFHPRLKPCLIEWNGGLDGKIEGKKLELKDGKMSLYVCVGARESVCVCVCVCVCAQEIDWVCA